MAKIKKQGHLLVGKDTLDLFKSLIDALRYEYDYDESTEPMGTLVNIYKDTEDCYKEMATDTWSAKKSIPMKKYYVGDLIDIENELQEIILDFINNNSGAIQIWYEDKSKYEKLRYYLKDAQEYIQMDMPTKAKQSLMDYLNECDYNADAIKRVIGMIDAFDDVDGSAKSTKKSIPKSKDTKMSFTDNVNKMRVNNYAKTGNINTVMKKRD